MDLFEQASGELRNILPKDGVVHYFGNIISTEEANLYLNSFLETISWENDQAIVFGKKIVTKRKVAWYGDKAFQYTYSHVAKTAVPWTKELQWLKALVEKESGETFNSCLVNLYHNGAEGVAWHSDSEKSLKEQGAIASVSLGAERKFSFKHKKSKELVSLFLQNGSLLIMKGETQKYWLHCLPTTVNVSTARINLTFRTIVE